MHQSNPRQARLLAVTLLTGFALFAAACGDDDTSASGGTTDTSAADDTASASDSVSASGELDGEFLVSGSSTVYPIVLEQAEAFGAANGGVAISVEGPGSGDGAQKFCNGEVPIANASRTYKDAEIEICEANGIEFIEIRRGIDGISVVTSPENDAVECVSFNQLYSLISEEATGSDSWADGNGLLTEMGAVDANFPDAQLDVFGPGEESGTFDSFAEIVIESVAKGKTGLDSEAREFVKTIRPDYTSSPDDNIIVEGISSSQYSIGWVGFAFAKEAEESGQAKLLAVSKEDGGECVTPSPGTIASAEFPIARFLYTYVNAAAANDPAVVAFVDYMMSAEGLESVTSAGYIDLSNVDQSLAQAIWENRTTGRSWG